MADPVSKFGGVPVDEGQSAPQSKFGGIPVAQQSADFESGVQKLEGGAPYRFASNLAAGLNPVSALAPLTQPIETAKAIGQNAVSKTRESLAAAKGGQYGRAALSAVEAVPLVGNLVSGLEGDVSSGNVAGALGTVGAAAAPFVAGRMMGLVPNKVGGALEDSAVRQYSRVLGPTTKPNKFRAAGVVSGYDASAPELGPGATERVPGLLERGTMALTRKGLQGKIQGTVADLSQQLENEWGKLSPDQGPPLHSIDLELSNCAASNFMYQNPVTKAWSATSPDAENGLAFMGKLRDYLSSQAVPDGRGGQYVPWETLRRFRQDWDGMANAANAYSGGDLTNNVKAAGYTASANGVRQILNSGNPTISAINRELSFWKDGEKVISDTMARTTSQAKPLGVKMARVAGQAVGFTKGGPIGAVLGGEAMDAVESAIRSPAWQTVSAVAKDRLAKAIATGNSNLIKRTIGGIVGGNLLTPAPILAPPPPPQ